MQVDVGVDTTLFDIAFDSGEPVSLSSSLPVASLGLAAVQRLNLYFAILACSLPGQNHGYVVGAKVR